MYTVQCTVYDVQCIVYTIYCTTLYTVHCTLHRYMSHDVQQSTHLHTDPKPYNKPFTNPTPKLTYHPTLPPMQIHIQTVQTLINIEDDNNQTMDTSRQLLIINPIIPLYIYIYIFINIPLQSTIVHQYNPLIRSILIRSVIHIINITQQLNRGSRGHDLPLFSD